MAPTAHALSLTREGSLEFFHTSGHLSVAAVEQPRLLSSHIRSQLKCNVAVLVGAHE